MSKADKNEDKAKRQARRRKSKQASGAVIDHELMKALANPSRAEVLRVLTERIASPAEMAFELGIPLSRVSYYATTLRRGGLIEIVREVPRRGATEHFYEAVHPTLVPPALWKGLPASIQKGVAMDILREFFEDVAASLREGITRNGPSELSWTPLLLDAQGSRRFFEICSAFTEELIALQGEVDRRQSEAEKPPPLVPFTGFIGGFRSARSATKSLKSWATKRLST